MVVKKILYMMKKNIRIYFALFSLAIITVVNFLIKNHYSPAKNEMVSVAVFGVQHLGNKYSVSSFYVNKYGGVNIQRGSGESGLVCCVMIPVIWRPNVVIEIQWEVQDWSKENFEEVENGNFKSISSVGIYSAQVPLEKYSKPGDLYVHFFSGGKVRIVSTMYSTLSPLHPINSGHADENLTTGRLIKELSLR